MSVFYSCQEEENGPLFMMVSAEDTGIDFNNQLTETDTANIIQYLYYYNGSGLATGDLNNDGLPDLFFGGNQVASRVYINTTKDGELSFQDVTYESGVNTEGTWTTGVNMVDVNGDNLLDIYVCQVNHKSFAGYNRLYINQGITDGIPRFVESAQAYGLDFQGLSTQSAFLDYDRDGDLDMYLLNHSVHAAENYTKSQVRENADTNGDRLYRNDGNVFTDVTAEAGIYSSKIGFGLGIGISDLDGDGYPDIYVGNDFHENDYVYLNNADGTFREVVTTALGHSSQFSMGLDIADINNDGHMDILTMDMMPEDPIVKKSSVPSDNYDIYRFKHEFGYHYQFPRNNMQLYAGSDSVGTPLYSEIGQLMGIEDTDWSWSGLLADYNNDGYKDLYVTNGIVRRPNDLDYLNYLSDPLVQREVGDIEMAAKMPVGLIANYLFENRGELKFENISDRIDVNPPNVSTAAVYADLDADGDLDIVTNNINSQASILVNQQNTASSITISLKGLSGNTKGIGAKIKVKVGNNEIYTEYNPSKGFMSASAGDIVIGVGDVKSVDEITVTWPTGKEQIIKDAQAGSSIVVEEADAMKPQENRIMSPRPIFEKVTDIINYTHQENDYIDANSDKLIPWLLSTQGPALAVGDINGDNLEDVYIGGARGQAGVFMVQSPNGTFSNLDQEFLVKDAIYEDVDALFVDVDGDDDLDLYVVSGGNEQLMDSPFLLDRIYLNDGLGNYKRNPNALPLITENGSSVSAADYDNDGDQDLIIGILVMANTYGLSTGARLLRNDGKGKFQDITTNVAPDLRDIGMITDVSWGDVDGDGDEDIVLVGEWMPIVKMINTGGRFALELIEGTIGLWRSLEVVDIDYDGDLDILGGNYGTNTFLAQDEGVGLTIGDMDGNRVFDALMYTQKDGVRHPVAGKDLLTAQMNSFKSLHDDYASFAIASFDNMFAPVINKIVKNTKLQELETGLYINNGSGSYAKEKLPSVAQLAPIFAFASSDMNQDGIDEIILGGNLYEVSPHIGRADASYGVYLSKGLSGTYESISSDDTGLLIRGQVRDMKNIDILGVSHLLVAKNNAQIELWRRSPSKNN